MSKSCFESTLSFSLTEVTLVNKLLCTNTN